MDVAASLEEDSLAVAASLVGQQEVVAQEPEVSASEVLEVVAQEH